MHQKTHSRIFTEALRLLTQTQKQPQCSSTIKCINKLWFIHIIQYYTTVKKKKKNIYRDFPGGSVVKNPPANAGAVGDSSSTLGKEDPLEKEMVTYSSILGAWGAPWLERVMGLERVRHD